MRFQGPAETAAQRDAEPSELVNVSMKRYSTDYLIEPYNPTLLSVNLGHNNRF